MSEETSLVLAVLAALLFKHFLFDFVFQRPYQFLNKGTYGHPGGILHAGLHAVGSIPAFLIIPPPLWVGALIVLGEFVIHYHLDWAKEQINYRLKLGNEDSGHFVLLGADQMLHGFTYVGIAAILISID